MTVIAPAKNEKAKMLIRYFGNKNPIKAIEAAHSEFTSPLASERLLQRLV